MKQIDISKTFLGKYKNYNKSNIENQQKICILCNFNFVTSSYSLGGKSRVILSHTIRKIDTHKNICKYEKNV